MLSVSFGGRPLHEEGLKIFLFHASSIPSLHESCICCFRLMSLDRVASYLFFLVCNSTFADMQKAVCLATHMWNESRQSLEQNGSAFVKVITATRIAPTLSPFGLRHTSKSCALDSRIQSQQNLFFLQWPQSRHIYVCNIFCNRQIFTQYTGEWI